MGSAVLRPIDAGIWLLGKDRQEGVFKVPDPEGVGFRMMQDDDDVEAGPAFLTGWICLHELSGSGGETQSLGVGHTHQGKALRGVGAGFHLGKDEQVTILGYDVDLSMRAAKIAPQDGEALFGEIGRGEVLADMEKFCFSSAWHEAKKSLTGLVSISFENTIVLI